MEDKFCKRGAEPIAEPRPASEHEKGKPKIQRHELASGKRDDPLLRVEEYSYDGPTGPTANKDLDLTIEDS